MTTPQDAELPPLVPRKPLTPRKLRGLLIDPQALMISEVSLPDDSEDTIAELLGCGLVEGYAITLHDSLILDTDGKASYPNRFGYFGIRNDEGELTELFAGRGLILGVRDCYFDSTRLSLRQVEKRIFFPLRTPNEHEVTRGPQLRDTARSAG
jgi:hypothetical protein